jgi:Fe-S-cluster-containing hydrogenase component 2
MAPASTITADDLRTLPLFGSLDASSVAQILKGGRIVDLKPRQRISGLGRDAGGESYCFVLAGQLAIVLDRGTPGGDAAQAEPAKVDRQDVEYLGSFAPGDFFSDGYLDLAPRDGRAALDCMATSAVKLLASPATLLTRMLHDNAGWAAELGQAIAASRRRFLGQQEPTRRIVQDFFLRQGLGSSQRVRVAEMSRCFDCNKCAEACAERHGRARMARAHTRLGRLAFQKFCLNCTEQACLAACAFDAMLTTGSGEIRITDGCNGCGACARKCPYGAIEILDVPYTTADFPSPVPVSNDNGSTAIPGLFVAGEVAGPRPTKVAIGEAKRAVDAMQVRRSEAGERAVLDAIIIGAGTAGMAAAQRCNERKLNFLVLEKDRTLSGKAARQAPVLRIQPGMEVMAVTSAGRGYLRVDVAQGSYVAQNVLVCTGRPAAGQPSLLGPTGIPMIEPGTREMAAHVASRGVHAVASKCDNCAGYPDRACLRACPTGTLIELSPSELFFARGAAANQQGNFSAVAFVEGVAEHRARAKHHRKAYWIFSAVLLFALAAVGIESFLRRVLPEHSVVGMVRAWVGSHDPVWYKSGRGFGHWLGYLGTGFMLSTLFYPLRTRLGVLKSWGVQSTWLTFHLWVGFIGATLVTYHAAFKLDRWVALACYAMWAVVLSGAVGRYLYGMVHSGIGLVQFEGDALSYGTAWQAATRNLGARSVRLLTAEPQKPGPIYTEMFVMLWHELRDFSILLWLRFAGLSHLPTRRARRETLQYLSDLASHRRARRYLESAKRLLRYWNWVHIVLTIAMFVLSGFHIAYGFMYKAV